MWMLIAGGHYFVFDGNTQPVSEAGPLLKPPRTSRAPPAASRTTRTRAVRVQQVHLCMLRARPADPDALLRLDGWQKAAGMTPIS